MGRRETSDRASPGESNVSAMESFPQGPQNVDRVPSKSFFMARNNQNKETGKSPII